MSEETISQPRIKITWFLGTLVAFGLFLVIGFYSKRMTRDYTDYDQQIAQERYATLAKSRQDENKLIYPVDAQGHSTAEWVDQTKGLIRINIDEAMAKEIDTLKAQPAAMGGEIPGAVPAPAPAPAASAPAANTPATEKPAAAHAAPAKPTPANK